MGTGSVNGDIKKKMKSIELLFSKKPKRIFTFGCSFTNWCWTTWADILGYELNIPFYNYGRAAAGNQYIFNVLMQAINTLNVDSDDLIAVCWTNVCREDRRLQEGWVTPGNIFTALDNVYNEEYLKKFVNFPVGYAVRDFATIDAVRRILDSIGCQYHFFSMSDFDLYDQWGRKLVDNQEISVYNKINQTYKTTLDIIKPSFYRVLWNNEISLKFKLDREIIHEEYIDGHPSPIEHLRYLQTVFPTYCFAKDTIDAVADCDDVWVRHLKSQHQKIDNAPTEQKRIVTSEKYFLI